MLFAITAAFLGLFMAFEASLAQDHSIETELDLQQQTVHGWIGAQLTDLSAAIKQHLNFPDSYGVYVQDTIRNSPAQTAGILPGDIITQINDMEVFEVLPTINLIAALQPGRQYPVMVFRQGQYLQYNVTIATKA